MTAQQALIVDAWQFDGVKPADVATLVAAGAPWSGMIVQATHGKSLPSSWFNAMWPELKRAAGPRYGIDWLRGAYHYLIVGDDERTQAEMFVRAIETAGGWGDGDVWPAVDVERGEQPPNASAAQVEHAVSSYAEHVLRLLGKRPLGYLGSYTRDLGIKSRMGCALLWYPQWDATLSWGNVARMGWDQRTTLLWQYCGDGNAQLAGYPHTTPIGKLDISVMVRDNLPYAQGLDWTRTHTGAQPT